MCLQRTFSVFTEDISCVYRGQILYLQRTYPVFTEDISCAYRGHILCLRKTYPVFTEDISCVYREHILCLQRTNKYSWFLMMLVRQCWYRSCCSRWETVRRRGDVDYEADWHHHRPGGQSQIRRYVLVRLNVELSYKHHLRLARYA